MSESKAAPATSRRPNLLQVIRTIFRRRPRRVPLILQMTPVECGAACLAMILGYYGRRVGLTELRQSLGPSRDGIKASSLVRVACNYGLSVKSYSLEPDDLKYIQLPAIAHWKFEHFVVLEEWTPKSVQLTDPAIGRVEMSAQEFAADFTGVLMTFQTGASFASSRETVQPGWVRYLFSIFEIPGAQKALAQILAASLLMQLLGLALPLLTKVLVDQVLPDKLSSMMSVLGIGMLILVTAQVVSVYLRAALLIYLRGRLDTNLMSFFFEHLLSLPYSFFHQRTIGDLVMRLSSNTLIRETLTNQTLSLFLDVPFLVVYLLILLSQSAVFGLLVLLIAALQITVILITFRRVHRVLEQGLAAQAEEQGFLVESLKGIATLKASGSEHRVYGHWSNLFHKQLNLSLRASHLSALIETALFGLRTLAPLLLLWFGALLVLREQLSLGTMLALTALAVAFLEPLRSLITNAQQLQLVGAYVNRITDVLETEPEPAQNTAQSARRLGGAIEVRNLGFRYSSDSPPVLRDICLSIRAGEKIALVGPTGSGKSTIALLLLGLYQPSEGQILYDGIAAEEHDLRSLRNQLGVVLQEPVLFSGTIRQNILQNNPGMNLDEVIKMAKMAGIHEEIGQMPLGYETFVAEGGSALSGGQRQRLAIARALATNPTILILDEATSHLDVATEAKVERNLDQLQCTRIIIAHRLSTICNADRILVLSEGRIAESGSHSKLLTRGGIYAGLVAQQGQGEHPAKRTLAGYTQQN